VAFRPAILSYDQLRERATAFLEEFHEERTLPVPIEEIVEFDFGIEVIPIDGILEELEVDAFLTSDLHIIYVDEFVMKHRHRRLRFSLAHELAHHELHGPLYEETTISSVQDWCLVQEAISEEDYAWFEYQANSLAGLILVPRRELESQFTKAVARARKVGLSDETIDSEAGRTYIANALAREFDVSTQVIEKRMEKDGFWSPPPGASTKVQRRRRK
jgi:Zn-dependent peptidase ImmA (M78 family)